MLKMIMFHGANSDDDGADDEDDDDDLQN